MLTVHCPRCATALMLDPASISDSHGWARCGHCQRVFDAGRLGLPTLDPHAQPTQARSAPAAATPSAAPSRTDAAQAGAASPEQAEVPIQAEPDHIAALDTAGGKSATSARAEPSDASRSDVASIQAMDLERLETGDAPDPVSDGPTMLGWPDGPTDIDPLQGLSVDVPTPHDGLGLGSINDSPRANTDPAWSDPRHDRPADAHQDLLADPVQPHALFDVPLEAPDADSASNTPMDPLLSTPAQWLNDTGEAAPEQASGHDTALLAAAVAPADEADTPPMPATRSSRRPRLWRSALLLILLLLLAAQAVVLRRDWLAARFPQLEMPLSQMCSVLGCELGAWRDVSELHVTQSAVVRMHDTHFQLDLDIENASLTRVAVPVLELTLKDDQEHVWSRRLLPLVVEGEPPYLSAQSRYKAQVNWRTNEADAPLVQSYAVRLVYADSKP